MKKIKTHADSWSSKMIQGTEKEFKTRLKKLDKIWEDSTEKIKPNYLRAVPKKEPCLTEHVFVEYRKGSWHTVKCEKCGFVKEEYDSSD